MPKQTKLKYGVLSNILFLARDMAKEHPMLIFFLLLEMTLSVISPVLSLYVPKVALDLVTTGADMQTVFVRLGGLGLAMTAAMALSSMAGRGKYMMYNHMRLYYQIQLFLKSLDCDYEQVESAEGRAQYARARETITWGDQSGTSRLIVFSLDIFVAAFSFVLYSTILSTLNFYVVGILVGLSLINFFAMKHAQTYEHGLKDETSKVWTQLNYVDTIAGNMKWGKEIRLYSMRGWLLSVWAHLLQISSDLARRIQRRYFWAGTINALTLFLRDTLTYGYLIWMVSIGNIGVGDFVLYFGAVTGFSGFVGRIINDLNELHGANLKMNDLRAFLDNTDAPEPEHPASLPTDETFSIEFRHVTFSYDKNSAPVLKDFCMTVGAGEKIALVGVNGAGKTTLVKLLCGLYQPDSGEILINGMNVNQFRKKDLYKLFSAVFQDILILPFTVAENVSMKLLAETDMKRVETCLKQAGLYDVIATYPDKTKSYMLKAVREDGIVLSGGQNQKLLMARALYKDAPILILDEPTAALDPIAESETYEQFHALSGRKTSIYISHRLASTRFCDRIIFLNDGIAAEVGTHDELLAKGGAYAEMFALQSHYYKQEGGNADA